MENFCEEIKQEEKEDAALAPPVFLPVNKKGRFPCPLCPASFAYQSNLNTHTQGVHEKKCAFKCTYVSPEGVPCGSGFQFNSGLKTHALIHTDTRPFSCDVCQKGFRQRGQMLTHKKASHGDHPPRKRGRPRAAASLSASSQVAAAPKHEKRCSTKQCEGFCEEILTKLSALVSKHRLRAHSLE